MEKTGTFESTWHLLINGNIRWQYTFSRQANRMSLNHGFVVLFWCGEWVWNKECNTNYSYKLVTTFKVVSEVVYGSLPTMGKQENPIGVTWHADLCHLAPNLLYNILLVNRFQRSGSFRFWVTWTEVRRTVRVTSNLPLPSVGVQTLKSSILGRDRHPKDVRTQNACALLTYTI